MHYRFYIAFWILFFLVFAGASAWSFVLATQIDGEDQTDPENTKWKTGSYIAGGIYALLACLSILIGIIHTNHLKAKGYIDGLSPADQAARLNNGLASTTKNYLVGMHNGDIQRRRGEAIEMTNLSNYQQQQQQTTNKQQQQQQQQTTNSSPPNITAATTSSSSNNGANA